MSAKNPKAGRGPCPVCGSKVMFRASSSGKLTFTCDECDFSGYADPGGQAHEKLSASITQPAPAPSPAPEPQPTPPRRAQVGAFS